MWSLATFGLYFILMLIIGYCGYRATHNLSDYLLGGRRLGSLVTALSAGASDMSGWLLMGLPGAVFLSGLSATWIALGLIVGAWLNWTYVAGRLRVYTEKCGNALTLPEYFSQRFEDRSHGLRILTAVVILIFFTMYCASGVVASARLFEHVFTLSYSTAVLLGASATILYVFMGGFLAVSWTDTVQASLMLLALIVVPCLVIRENHGIFLSVQHIRALNPSYLSIGAHLSGLGIFSLLAWGLGYFGQPHILVRFMAAASAQTMPAARKISMTWMILCLVGAMAIGFFGIAYYAVHSEVLPAVASNAETVFMVLTQHLLTPWLSGIFLAAILAAIMSTLSCQLLVCSSALTNDLYKTWWRPHASQRELVWCGRAMVLVIASVAIFIATDPGSKILTMVSYAWAGFGAAFGPAVLLSLVWARMTKLGAMAGMIVGAGTVIIWKQYAWFSLYEMVPGFIFACLAIVITSLLSAPPSAGMLRIFNQVRRDSLQ